MTKSEGIYQVYDKKFIEKLQKYDKFCNYSFLDVYRNEYLRKFIEKWFKNLPMEEKKDSYSRLRSLKNSDYLSAFWELLLHQYALEEGWIIKKNPVVEGNKTPDFYIDTNTNEKTSFYLEVYSFSKNKEEQKKECQKYELLREINKIKSKFTLSINFRDECEDNTGLKNVKEKITQWLSGHLKIKDQLKIDNFGVDIEVTVLSYNKDFKEKCVGSYSSQEGVLNYSIDKLKGRMAEKKRKYKFVSKEKPFILAITADELDWGDKAIEFALYGRDIISFSIVDPDSEVKFHKDNSGFITPNKIPNPIMNTRLSAVMFCRKRWIKDRLYYDIRIYHNPWAKKKISKKVFGEIPQFVQVEENLEFIELKWENEDGLVSFAE